MYSELKKYLTSLQISAFLSSIKKSIGLFPQFCWHKIYLRLTKDWILYLQKQLSPVLIWVISTTSQLTPGLWLVRKGQKWKICNSDKQATSGKKGMLAQRVKYLFNSLILQDWDCNSRVTCWALYLGSQVSHSIPNAVMLEVSSYATSAPHFNIMIPVSQLYE